MFGKRPNTLPISVNQCEKTSQTKIHRESCTQRQVSTHFPVIFH
uniref:Uncharacterized protein n=1 Tax=Anguilla anguilla TaxID=7936 RepID=A0A0E9UTD1_ANGAN